MDEEGKHRFRLSKWYMDCVTSEGIAEVFYCARLQWYRLSLDYSSRLSYSPERGAQEHHSLHTLIPPHVCDGTWRWSSHALGCSGSWLAEAAVVANTFLDNADGHLIWTCFAPNARAEISVDGQTIHGLGYLEHVDMTISPSRTGLKELCWGRFLTESDTIVWTDWRGDNASCLVFVNGLRVNEAKVSAESVSLGAHGTLQLPQGTILREGPLVSTALVAIPGLREMMSRNHLDMYEQKALTRGVFVKADGSTVEGWAIHEVVRWR